ncbi:hypothetical protein HDU79_008691 [Rhizoclosmatium sp. JEL0117]|nr:hypothetical protein HDU79_008691 [Rhizoclosmatium sp. JEL0117]
MSLRPVVPSSPAPPADTPQAQVPTKSNQPRTKKPRASFYALGLSESGTRFRLVEMEGQEAIAQETTLAALDALLLDSDRLLFAATGKLFSPSSPLPFGGPRTKPGYVNYRGSTTQDLKRYIVSEMYRLYSITRCRKLLKYVATCFHCVLDYQQDGRKDDLDELMLKGMKRSGHIDWSGARYIPEGLQHRSLYSQDSMVPYGGVEFSVKGRFGMRREDHLVATFSESPSGSASGSECPSSTINSSNSGSAAISDQMSSTGSTESSRHTSSLSGNSSSSCSGQSSSRMNAEIMNGDSAATSPRRILRQR